MTMTRTPNTRTTTWKGFGIVAEYSKLIPPAQTKAQADALAALGEKDGNRCKVLAACHLSDPYIKAIGYLSSVEKVADAGLPTLPTLMSEAARAIAEATAEQAPSKRHESAAIAAYETKLAQLEKLNRKIFGID